MKEMLLEVLQVNLIIACGVAWFYVIHKFLM